MFGGNYHRTLCSTTRVWNFLKSQPQGSTFPYFRSEIQPNVKCGLDSLTRGLTDSRTHGLIPEMKIALILADMEHTVNIKWASRAAVCSWESMNYRNTFCQTLIDALKKRCCCHKCCESALVTKHFSFPVWVRVSVSPVRYIRPWNSHKKLASPQRHKSHLYTWSVWNSLVSFP